MKTLALPLAFAAGILGYRALSPLSVLTPYLLMTMLLLTFLRLRMEHLRVRRQHIILFVTQLLLSLVTYFAILPVHPVLALAGFMVCITPTAASAPAMVGMLGGNVEFVTVSSVLGNIVMAALLPVLLTLLTVQREAFELHAFGVMLIRVLSIVMIPLFTAVVLRHVAGRLATALCGYAPASFYLWTIILTIVCAKSTLYLRHNPQPLRLLVAMGALSLFLCSLHFWLGRRIGGREFAMEAGQSLGQRNTLFTIWVSLSILASPLVALGPTFYILWHNVFNAVQLWRSKPHRPQPAPVDA